MSSLLALYMQAIFLSQSKLLFQIINNGKETLLNLVSWAENHPDSRPELAGEQPEYDGTDVLSVPFKFEI